MLCPSGYCSGSKNRDMYLCDEVEVHRIRGNNFDIVTYEQVLECRTCGHEERIQESQRECVSTMDTMTDEQSWTESPARFGT